MRLLLDTHALVWWLEESPRLSNRAREAITADDSIIHVSVATAWEIAIKVGLGKLPEASEILASFEAAVAAEGFLLHSITVPHVRLAGAIVSPHRDPFDRLLAAQAVIDGMSLVSSDTKIAGLGAAVLW